MILARKSFFYKDTVVIEKITAKLPFTYEASFQNEGCFLMAKDVGARIFSIAETKIIRPQEAVLLKCGTYFVDWINSNSAERVEVIAFHLPSWVLKELYAQDLPQFGVAKNNIQHLTTVVKDEVLSRFVESLEFYFDHPNLVSDDTVSLKIKELILLLLQSTSFKMVKELFSNIFSPNEVSFKEIIHQHRYSNLGLRELAKLTHRSISSFKRDFQQHFNQSPGAYFLDQKIIKAKSLLLSTSLTIAEIAFEIGFDDPSYFSRIFCSKAGLSPRQYRLSERKGLI